MDRNIIYKQGCYKYYKVALLSNVIKENNVDMDVLLTFIGKHMPYRDRNEIGSAYVRIREIVNTTLNLKKSDGFLYTSKREVASIRKYYKYLLKQESHSTKYVMIPYKIAYIFSAIIQLVEIIHNQGIDYPSEIKNLIGKEYKVAFYNDHMEAYYASFPISPNQTAQLALKSDFEGAFSPLNHIFQ